jgi:hypothetical protein
MLFSKFWMHISVKVLISSSYVTLTFANKQSFATGKLIPKMLFCQININNNPYIL